MAGIFDTITSKLLGDLGQGKQKEIESPSDQTQDVQDLAGFVRKKVEEVRAQANRIAHEGIWMTNIAYLLGFDSVYYDTTTRQYRPLDRANTYLRRNRLHSNLILPAVQNRLARLCKVPPKFDVRPNSMKDEDKEAARLGLEILTELWDREELNRKRLELLMWVQQCGHAYLKIRHDDTLGDPLVDPISGDPIGYEGQVCIDISSPFEVFVDPLAKNMKEAAWVIHAKVRKLDYFKTHYPGPGDAVKAEGAWLLSAQYEMRINSLNTVGPTASPGITQQMEHAAIELAYYEKRSRKHRNGRLVIVANGILLHSDELPVGEIPFVKFDDVLIAGKFYSESTITHARPLQDQYNRTITKRAEWMNKMLAGKYIAEKRHGISQESFNDQSGEVLQYTMVPGVGEPQALQAPVIPAYAYQETQQLEKDLNAIFGLSDVSRGQIPAAGIPAIGMQLLLEQDETRIGIETEQHEHAFANVGALALKYIAKFYQTERTLKTKGKYVDYQVRSYTGQDLRSSFDVTVIRGSTIPTSKSMRRQEILNAWSQGLLGDPHDPTLREKILGMLEYGDVSEMWRSQAIDKTQIDRDIKMIEQEQIPEVSELDNHQLHVLLKNDYRKSDKWFLLSQQSQAILLQNIDKHLDAYATIQNPQLMAPPPGLGAPAPRPAPTLEDPSGTQGPLDQLAGNSPMPQNSMQPQ